METLKTRWLEILEDLIIGAALLLLAFGVAGCVPGGMFMHDPSMMSPEQLEQLQKLGFDAIRCGTVKGPPPGGTVSSVTIPKNRKAIVKFVGCDVQSVEVGDGPPPVPIMPLK